MISMHHNNNSVDWYGVILLNTTKIICWTHVFCKIWRKKKEEKISFLTNGTYLECLQSLKNDIKQALYLLFKLISNCKYIFLCFDKESQEIFSLFYIIPSKSYICKVQEKFNKSIMTSSWFEHQRDLNFLH